MLATVACRHRGHPAPPSAPFHPLPPLGARILVLAPHPDVEVLAGAGVIDATLRRGGDVHVVVATDGESVRNRAQRHLDELANQRRVEARQALETLGVGPDHVSFLGYADGSLETAWTERWTAILRGHGTVRADSIVEDLRRAIRDAAPTAILFPLPLDEHAEHRALGRFTLLALLADDGGGATPPALAYLIHGHRHWARRPPDPAFDEPPPNGCPGALYRWSRHVLAADAVFRKAALVKAYRSQSADARRLLRYASRSEPFARGTIVSAPRAAAPTRPGVRATRAGVVVRVPAGPCGVVARDRLRLRFFRGGRVEERVVADRRGRLEVDGGPVGDRLAVVTDVRAMAGRLAIRLLLAPSTFRDVPGVVLEVVPADHRRAGPVWLVRWAGAS